MQFELTEEQRMIQDTAREFAKGQIAPIAEELDKEHRYPAEIVKQMGELGFMGMFVPEEWGGAGVDVLSYVLALIEICKADAGTGVVMSVNNSLASYPLYAFGNDAQKGKYLKALATGEKLGCYCLTEPGAGSDAAAQKTTAVRDGDNFILNGTKSFITNGLQADVAIVYAVTDPSKGVKGITAFIVENTFPGYSVGKVEDKMGIKSSTTTQIILEDCVVPAENILGEEGKGFTVAMATLEGGRIGIAAQAVGIAEAAFEEAMRYVQEREAFGKKIASFQGLQWYLAEMATRLEAAKLLVYSAAYRKSHGLSCAKESSMAKLYAAEAANFITDKAVQIFGGYGYLREYPVERYYRDAKITEIYEGTSEVQKMVIAKNLLNEYAID